MVLVDSGYHEYSIQIIGYYSHSFSIILGESKCAFQNLKKSYSKKRNNLKKAKRSGAGLKDIQKYEKQLEECAFLGWLNNFVSLRDDTKNNITNGNNGQDFTESSGNDFGGDDDDDDDDDDDNNDYDIPSDAETVAKLVCNKRKIPQNRDAQSRFDSDQPDTSSKGQICTPKETAKSQTSREPPRSKYRINEKKAKRPNVDDASVEALKAITKRLTEKAQTATPTVDKIDDDEVFGKMVTAELKKLSQEFKIRLKHGINNLIFQYQIANLQKDKASNDPVQHRPPVAGANASTPAVSPFTQSPTSSYFQNTGGMTFQFENRSFTHDASMNDKGHYQ